MANQASQYTELVPPEPQWSYGTSWGLFFSWLLRLRTFVQTFVQNPGDIDITGGSIDDTDSALSVFLTDPSSSITVPTLVASSLINAGKFVLAASSTDAYNYVAASNGGTTDYSSDMDWTLVLLANSGIATHTLTLGVPTVLGQVIFVCSDNAIAALTVNGASGVTIQNFDAADFASTRRVAFFSYQISSTFYWIRVV